MQNATIIPGFAEYAPRWCDTIELRRTSAGSYTATVTDDNEVLGDYNFAANSGSGITFTRKGNTLTITATAAAAKNLDTEKTYSATGSAYEIDPDRAVICWYDRTGRYQAMAGYTGVGRDPVKAYIKIKAVEEKGSITVRKVVATGAPLAGAELLLETSTDGQTWTEVSLITTDKTGSAKWSDLKIGVQYRITEVKAPAGYTLLTEPLFAGALDSNNRDITITACNNAGFALPFTGGTGFTTYGGTHGHRSDRRRRSQDRGRRQLFHQRYAEQQAVRCTGCQCYHREECTGGRREERRRGHDRNGRYWSHLC